MCSRICSSQLEFEDFYTKLNVTQCPHCNELRATVNPSNNLAHCFSCGKNINNIDLILILGHDFLPAVGIMEK